MNATKSLEPLAALPLTQEPGNHFFGFHDLCPFDEGDARGVVVRTAFLDRPPDGTDEAEIVVVEVEGRRHRVIGRTAAWNFPQGARQQWWPGKAGLLVFNRWAGGRLEASVCSDQGREVGRIPGGIYAFSPDGQRIYSLDFGRLHRLGGYGYSVAARAGVVAPCPEDDGIWCGGGDGAAPTLLLSIHAVATALGLSGGASAPLQYLTHIVPSPSGRRLCFLHRYLLPDGGLNTTVCVCARDGSGLRALGSGFYSHFDWADDDTLLIWGRGVNRVHALRNSRLPVVGQLLRLARPVYRAAKRLVGSGLIIAEHYYLIDVNTGAKRPFLADQLREDGHPCFYPGDRRWLATDTYPDRDGYRNLFLVDARAGKVQDLGRLPTPQLARREDVGAALRQTGLSEEVLAQAGAWEYFRSRSGYSCDFHPRFNRRGSQICIDSLHGGTRQVYLVDVPPDRR